MKKRVLALVLCLLMAVQLASFPAGAVDDVIFVGAEENILPLSDETMPFWHNGYLYISSAIFTGATRQSLEVSRASTNGGKLEILYRGGRSIWFEEGKGYARDAENDTYYPGGVMHNGTIYVPAALVAEFFGLEYSIVKVEQGSLVWLRQPDFGLSERIFVDAASGPINRRYADYLAAKRVNGQVQPDGTILPGTDSSASGKRVYLCMQAGEHTEELLEALGRYDARATFFCTPEFLAENGDLLRWMTGTGQSVGILVDGAHPEQTVEEQLAAGNASLALATSQKTRLARIENATDEQLEAARAAGYCLTASELEAYDMESVVQAAAVFQVVENRQGDSVAWLGDGASATGLVTFLALADQAQDLCLPLRETVTP